jgi:hypothetical protein
MNRMYKLSAKGNVVLRYLLLLLFLGFYSSNTLFFHKHIVNGSVLSHSHPFRHDKNSRTPFESHSHSPYEYNCIKQLNEASWKDTADSAEAPSVVVFHFEPCFIYNTPFITVSDYTFSQLRAPPSFC